MTTLAAPDLEVLRTCLHASEKRFRKGETICRYGGCRDQIGILESGRAQILRLDEQGNRSVLEPLAPGSVFGEILAFSPHRDDSSFVLALAPCRVLFLSIPELLSPDQKDPVCTQSVLNQLFRLVSQKALSLSKRVEILSCRSIRDKLLLFFRIQSDTANRLCFTLPFSLTDLADYICSDRSAMMRELKKLRDRRLVIISGRNVCLNPKLFEEG